MQIVINPQYESLRPWIEQLPNIFAQSGEVIYDARNQIRVIKGADGILYNVKRYHQPRFLNRIIYTLFRAPKAQRAYDNSLFLIEHGIRTPQAIAYILMGNCWLAESYLVTIQEPLHHTFYEFRGRSIEGDEAIVSALAQLAAEMHTKGIVHKDFSPGNILFDYENGKPQLSIVDINRMERNRYLTKRACCRHFCRLWGEEDFFRYLGHEYARFRGWDVRQTTQLIIKYHRQYWRFRT